MSWIVAVADYLQANNLGTKGTTLFIGERPDIDGLTTLLTEYQGNTIETFASGIALYQPQLQVRVAGASEDYAAPRARLIAIQTLLAGVTNQTLSGIRFQRIRPSTTILALGQDDVLAFEFSANFEVTYEE